MKSFKRTVGILVVLAMAMSTVFLTACGDDTPPGPGPGEATVSRITLNTAEAKLTYEIDETFSADGVKVTAYMSDDTNKSVAITDCTVSKPDMSAAGKKAVTVTYGGKSANYMITVNAPKAHECETACPVCGSCLDSECAEEACLTKCGELPSYKTYRLEAEDDHVELVPGARGALNKTPVITDMGVPEEIRERNKDIVYIGNYNANAGASINYTIYSPEATTATLYASVCRRMQSAIFTQGVGVLVNDDMLERPTYVPSTGVNTDTWADFVNVNIGCINLVEGMNRINLTNVASDFGYNFDKILIKSPVQIGWAKDNLIAPEVDKENYDAVFEKVETKTVEVTSIGADTSVKIYQYLKGTVCLGVQMAAPAEYTLDDLKENVTFELDGELVEVTLTEAFKGTGEGDFVKVAIGEGANGYNDLADGEHVLSIKAKGETLPEIKSVEINCTTYGIYNAYTALTLGTDSVKKTYVEGEEVDLTGLTVTATKRNGESVTLDIADCTVILPDTSVFGTKTVTVKAENATATFEITVNPDGTVIAFEGEDEKTILSEGCSRAGNKVGGFADAVGRKITYELYASAECDVMLYVTVSTNASGSFSSRVTTTLNDTAVPNEAVVPAPEGAGWETYATVLIGRIHLTEGKNVISFEKTGGGPGDGYNFDKMELLVSGDVTVGWWADHQV